MMAVLAFEWGEEGLGVCEGGGWGGGGGGLASKSHKRGA